MKKIHNLIIVLFLSVLASTCFAAQTTFTIVPSAPLPTDVLNGRTAVACYTVTSNCPFQLNGNGLSNIHPGVTQITTGTGVCGSTFDLAFGESCTLKLSIDTSQSGGSVIDGPVVCQSRDNPIYCSQPTDVNKLAVVPVGQLPADAPVLTVAPMALDLFIDGAPHGITVTNTSATVTANNVTAELPAALASEVNEINNTDCFSVPPGGTCMITFIAKDSAAVTAATAYDVFGANTQAVSPQPTIEIKALAQIGCTGNGGGTECRGLVTANSYFGDLTPSGVPTVDVSECLTHHPADGTLDRANCICQKEGAAANGNLGIWRAWLSTNFSGGVSQISAKDNIIPNGDKGYSYVQNAAPATQIAVNLTALTNTVTTDLLASVDPVVVSNVLTGTNPNGTFGISTCNDYTSTSAAVGILAGSANPAVLSSAWTSFVIAGCATPEPFYCFEAQT